MGATTELNTFSLKTISGSNPRKILCRKIKYILTVPFWQLTYYMKL